MFSKSKIKLFSALVTVALISIPVSIDWVYGKTGADKEAIKSSDGSLHAAVKTGHRRIAVIPFLNLTGSSDYNLWRENLPAAITSSMKERFEFTSVTGSYSGMGEEIAEGPPDTKELAGLGSRLGAHIILFGYYKMQPDGSSLLVTTMVYHVQLDEQLPPFEVSIKTNSSMFDSLSVEADRISSSIRIPFPPAEFTASKGVSTESIELVWKPSSGAEGYKVYRFDADAIEPSEIGDSSTASYADTIPISGRVYTFRVRAYSKYGMSRYSLPDSGFLKVRPPAIKAEEGGRDSVKITWDAVDGASGYDIFRASSKEGSYEKAGTTPSPGYADKPDKAGVRYWYRGQSLSEGGPGDLSDEVSGYMARPMMPYYLRGIVPGWGQIYAGNRYRGWAIAGAFTAASAGSLFYGINYYHSKSDYDSMGASSTGSEFDRAFSEYEHNALMANIFIGTAALVYVWNWIDLIFFTGADYQHVASAPKVSGAADICFGVRKAEEKNEPVINAGVTWSY